MLTGKWNGRNDDDQTWALTNGIESSTKRTNQSQSDIKAAKINNFTSTTVLGKGNKQREHLGESDPAGNDD